MSNLFDLDDENDELFKPNRDKKKPSRDLDDLFGTGTNAPAKSATLDDILAPNVEEDLFNSAIATSKSTASDDDLDDLLNAQPSSTVSGSGDLKPEKSKKVKKKTVNLFDNDVDDEPDIFGLGISSGKSNNAQSEPINDEDLFGSGLDNKAGDDLSFTNYRKKNKSPEITSDLLLDMNSESSALSSDVAVNGLMVETKKETEQDEKKNNKLDIFDEQTQPLPVTKSDDLVDLLGFNEIKTENQSSSASRIRADSLDMLLDEQPPSMIPGNDDLLSMMESDVKPRERKPVQRKPSKLNRKSKNINVDKSETSKEPKSLDDMLDAQPDGMVSVTDDLSSMLEKNSNVALDMQTESSDKQFSIALIESDLKNATKENDNVFDDQEVPDGDDGISTNIKQEVSEENLDKMLDAQPVGILSPNGDTNAIVSPDVAVNDFVVEASKDTEQDEKKINKLDIFDEQTQPLPVTKSDDLVDLLGFNEIKTETQSSSASRIRADSLDMLLDEQPASLNSGNDDMLSMMESDVKPRERKPVQRKPSKLNRKSKNINVDKSETSKEPKSLDDMLDAQPDGMVSISDDLSSMIEKNSNVALDMQTESSDKQFSIALIESDLKNATKENDNVFDDQEVPIKDDGISTNIKQDVSEENLDKMLDAQPVGILSPNDDTNAIVSPDVAVNDFVVEASKDTEQDEKKNNKLDIFDEQTQPLPVTKSDDLVDLFGLNEINSENQSSSASRNRADSLDMLLDEQAASLNSGNDDMLSMMESDVKPRERKPVQRKPSKLKRKSRNVNVDKSETSQEPSSLDDMLDAQPDGMVSISDDLSSMIVKNSNVALDTLPESSDHLGSVESDVKTATKENDKALNDQEGDGDDGISTNIKQETSVESLDKMLDAQPVGTLSPNDDIQSLVSPTEELVSKPLVKPRGKIGTVSKSSDVRADQTGISRPEQKSCNTSSDQSNEQSENNLDMLLDAQPDNAVPSNDDLVSLVMKNDTSSTESDVKARDRPSVRRKPSKLNRKSRNIDTHKSDKEPASLDDMLDAQPDGMVPISDDLLSLVEPITNNATSSNTNATPELVSQASPTKETDPVDDLFGESEGNLIDDFEFIDNNLEVDKSSGDIIEEEETDKCDSETEDKQPEQTIPTSKRKTNLKKRSMERSFEDLLNGLSDESEPELEDIIPDDIDNTNLESLLGSPDKSYRDIKPDTSVFTSKQIDDPFDMDSVVSSTPHMKITPPEVKVHTPEYEEEDYDISGDREFDTAHANVDDDDDNDVQMRPKPTRKSTLSSGDDVDLEVIEDTNHLDVDVSKHKSALGKKGSLALRRKQSRKSRKSLLSTGEDAIFQDSTDAKPEMMNGDDDDDETFGNKVDDDDDDRYDLSPPAKKPSPVTMMPLPGLAGRPPSQRLSSSQPDDDEEDIKEVKRKSKPPPGAFVLPPMGVSPKKPLRPSSESNEKSPRESKPITFEKPALKTVKPKERSRSPVGDATPSYARVGLRSADKSDVEMKSASEERDVTFQKPSLRSTPKPNKDRTPENKMDTNNGMFEKPALRNTSKPKSEQKQNRPEQDIFATNNLKSVPKPDIFTKDTSSDNHAFDKPHLKTTKRDGDSIKNEPSSKYGEKTFEKPTLRTTNKNLRSESTEDQGYEPSHVFEKPPLRTAGGRTAAVNKQDNFTPGMFEKPSLKKTTPSPEMEVKDIIEPKGTFDRPQLRKTDSLKEREERGRTPDTPSWLQKASDKHGRAFDALQTKENHSNSEKQLPSWLENSPLRKNIGLPLQDTSNNQSTSSSQSDLSTDDYGKLPSTPRSRNSSQGTENEPGRKASLPGPKGHNNYTPGWMRQARSPSVPGAGVIAPAKSMPALNESNEVPQWKKELAQRRQNRKEKTTEELSKKEDTAEPEWKKGIMLRKTRNTGQPSKETHSVEPEWKKAAEEKRQRLRSKSLQYSHLKLT